MSPRSPKCFARKETDIVTRGFISDILLDSTEEVRQEIYEVLHSTGLKSIGPKDFEFIPFCLYFTREVYIADIESKITLKVLQRLLASPCPLQLLE